MIGTDGTTVIKGLVPDVLYFYSQLEDFQYWWDSETSFWNIILYLESGLPVMDTNAELVFLFKLDQVPGMSRFLNLKRAHHENYHRWSPEGSPEPVAGGTRSSLMRILGAQYGIVTGLWFIVTGVWCRPSSQPSSISNTAHSFYILWHEDTGSTTAGPLLHTSHLSLHLALHSSNKLPGGERKDWS